MSTRNTEINDDVDVNSLRCHGDHVLIELYERMKTSGGIHLARAKATECVIGKVISHGKELPNSYSGIGYHIGVDVGDVVLTMGYVGERMNINGASYRFLHAHGIWAKVKMKDVDSFDIADLEPAFAFMLVELLDDEITKGGIILAAGHDAQEQLRRAKVLKVGPGPWDARTGKRIPVVLKPGDEVLMMRYAGADVEVNGKILRLIDYSDVKAGLEK